MGGIRVRHKGNFKNTERFFNKVLRRDWMNILADYGAKGVEILRNATPTDSGKTADSWEYIIERSDGRIRLAWVNTHENQGVNVAILIIYGHGLWNGGYVEGNDFVTPAIRPLLQELADRAWKGVVE